MKSPFQKTTFLGVGMALFFAALAPGATAATIAYWKFEPGALTLDSSGNGHTLVNTNVTSSTQVMDRATPISSGSASFNGAAHFRTAQPLALSSYNQLTIEFFIRQTATANSYVVFETGTNYNNNPGGLVTYRDGTGLVGSRRAGGNYDLVTVGQLTADTWIHYAYQVDLTAATPEGRLQLLINGVPAGAMNRKAATTAGLPDFNFFIGARGGSSLFFSGQLDELRISSGLLAPGELLYYAIPEPSSLALLPLAGAAAFLYRRRRA